MLAIRLKLALLSLPLAAGGCGSGSSVQHTNASTTEQLDQISQNTSDIAGASNQPAPATPDEVGQSMRAGAAAKPRQQ